MIKNIGFAITGSFCTHNRIIEEIQKLVDKGYNIVPIVSDAVVSTDTRFGTAEEFMNKLKEITKNDVIKSIVTAEPLGPKNMIDIMVIAPCTGNTLSKLANAITDNAVTMSTKAHLRNGKPVVIGVSSNDALGLNLSNIAKLMASKNVYFVPFGQDDYKNKPKSLICDWNKIDETMEKAYVGEQTQPVLLRK